MVLSGMGPMNSRHAVLCGNGFAGGGYTVRPRESVVLWLAPNRGKEKPEGDVRDNKEKGSHAKGHSVDVSGGGKNRVSEIKRK